MAYTSYTPYEWKNAPDHKTTPLSAANLNHMEGGIEDSYKFDNTGTNLSSTNKEDAIKEVNAKTSGLTRMTKLWENPSPTASFSAQQITLSSADYDFLFFVYSGSILFSSKIYKNCTVPKGLNAYFDVSRVNYSRQIVYTSDTILSVNVGYENATTNDNVCIPITIYGIKII